MVKGNIREEKRRMINGSCIKELTTGINKNMDPEVLSGSDDPAMTKDNV